MVDSMEINSEQLSEFIETEGVSDVTEGRHSFLLAVELYIRTVKINNLHLNYVLDEIKYLEGKGEPTGTKAESEFRGEHLRGLWHKHYKETGIGSLAANYKNALKEYGLSILKAKAEEYRRQGIEAYIGPEHIESIVKQVSQNYDRRVFEGKETGEWIIYAKHEGKNYYLCLATHDMDDSVIRQNIVAVCVNEFPFLSGVLSE